MIIVKGFNEAREVALAQSLSQDDSATQHGEFILLHKKGFVIEVSKSEGTPFSRTENGRVMYGIVFTKLESTNDYCLNKSKPEVSYEIVNTGEWVDYGTQKTRHYDVVATETKIFPNGYNNFSLIRKGDKLTMHETVSTSGGNNNDLSDWLEY